MNKSAAINKVAVTALYLINSVPQSIKLKSRDYEPNLVRTRGNSWTYKVGDYVVRIKVPVIISRKKLGKQDILVSCTCNFWKWNGPDYHASNQGYSERTFSDLSRPVERDPQNQYLICKHACAALRQFRHDFITR